MEDAFEEAYALVTGFYKDVTEEVFNYVKQKI